MRNHIKSTIDLLDLVNARIEALHREVHKANEISHAKDADISRLIGRLSDYAEFKALIVSANAVLYKIEYSQGIMDASLKGEISNLRKRSLKFLEATKKNGSELIILKPTHLIWSLSF